MTFYYLINIHHLLIFVSLHGIVHPGQSVALERTGQVVNQAVAAGSRLSVALKPQNVTVPVITRHLLRKPVGVRAYAAALSIGSGGQAVKAVIGKLVAAQGGLAARLPRQAADVAVVAGRAAAPSAIFNVFIDCIQKQSLKRNKLSNQGLLYKVSDSYSLG